MRVLLAQAPFTQLNAPYPAIHYLRPFLKGRGHDVDCSDMAILCFRSMFSRPGLEKIFRDARLAISENRLAPMGRLERDQVSRYLSNQAAYIDCVDDLVAFLAGQKPDYAFALSPAERLPYGQRVENYLAGVDESGSPEEPEAIASLILADLCDFIAFTLDPAFSLVRYAESKVASQPSLGAVMEAFRLSYVANEFVRPLARRVLEGPGPGSRYELVGVSVPFPGCLIPALAILMEAKALGARTVMGGAYVSTELRSLSNPSFFDWVDFLAFDGGYGALASILDSMERRQAGLYRVMRLSPGGDVAAEGFSDASSPYARLESEALGSIVPDFSGLDLGLYLRFRDSGNPMHALWSAGKWLKVRLAHGCYWGRCSFCDCELDYIKRYVPAPIDELFSSLQAQAKDIGANGLHFVDEAAPVPALLRFAARNAAAGRPFTFWGNSRFEALFTPDRARFLSWAGLLGLSAGIEVASPQGLLLSNKGIDMEKLVSCLDALGQASILRHAYLIHGLPGQDEAGLIDSLECLRQLFCEGLLESAFWHPFVLALHSPYYTKGLAGQCPPCGDFAQNDVEWPGARRFAGLEDGLEAALAAYMEGRELDRPVQAWFDTPLPAPSLGKRYIKDLLRGVRKARPPESLSQRPVWIGGSLETESALGPGLPGSRSAQSTVAWAYRNRRFTISLRPETAPILRAMLESIDPRLAPPRRQGDFLPRLKSLLHDDPESIARLREGGLLFI